MAYHADGREAPLGRKGQTWTSDLLFAVAVFMVTLILFFYVLNSSGKSSSIEGMKEQSNLLPQMFVEGVSSNSSVVFIVDNKVSVDRLVDVANMSYAQLKSALGVSYDFCIYFEDETGALINLSTVTGVSTMGIGSPHMKINGIACGQV